MGEAFEDQFLGCKWVVKDRGRAVLINWPYWKAFREEQPGSSVYLLAPEMEVLTHDPTSLERQFLFETLWRTGGKISEVLALRASDFQLAEGEEMVYFGGKKTGRAVEIVETRYLQLVAEFVHQHEGHAGAPLLAISRQTASNWLSRRLEAVRERDPVCCLMLRSVSTPSETALPFTRC